MSIREEEEEKLDWTEKSTAIGKVSDRKIAFNFKHTHTMKA